MLKWGRRLIDGGAYLIFPKTWSDMIGFFVIYVCVRPSEVSEGSSLSLEELRNITPIAGQYLPHEVGWALGHESADLHYHPLRRSIHSA